MLLKSENPVYKLTEHIFFNIGGDYVVFMPLATVCSAPRYKVEGLNLPLTPDPA